ncbi:MAG: cytidine deaminase [Anaerolineae bacterium]
MSQTSSTVSDTQWTALLAQAIEARQQSYSPYSHYAVGAALLTRGGKIYLGCNIENAGYTASVCAERVAIFKAIFDGERDFVAIAVATANGGAPCGVCRQVMREFAPDLTVVLGDTSGQYQVLTLPDLLPHSFGPENLPRQ